MFKLFLIAALSLSLASAAHNILDQANLTLGAGATPAQERANSVAFHNVVMQANASDDRVVLVPKGATIYMMPVAFEGLKDVVIDINGAIIASANWKEWPYDADTPANLADSESAAGLQGKKLQYHHFLQFMRCDVLTF